MNAEMKKQLENTLQVFLEKNQVLKLDIQVGSEGFIVLKFLEFMTIYLRVGDWKK